MDPITPVITTIITTIIKQIKFEKLLNIFRKKPKPKIELQEEEKEKRHDVSNDTLLSKEIKILKSLFDKYGDIFLEDEFMSHTEFSNTLEAEYFFRKFIDEKYMTYYQHVFTEGTYYKLSNKTIKLIYFNKEE